MRKVQFITQGFIVHKERKKMEQGVDAGSNPEFPQLVIDN